MRTGEIPEYKVEARRLMSKISKLTLIDDMLYKRGLGRPLLKCIDPKERSYIFREIHEGVYGYYSAGVTLAFKTMRQGYFYPTMKIDTNNFVKKFERCQILAAINYQPSALLCSINSPWSFAIWGINLIDELPIGKGNTITQS